eukprot:gnl/Spiro4/27364_TR13627_c0_g1_i1.p1 gnl/Spiro4/27364_TR13627_c0_g1~~gnl/Spiro4/27364_TR13627_c0_g1_i1.p1  ORF type:complete len:141 (-),score=16.55 gnl/Spiro4/27364_TR13627_c0_g1_i1:56-478(-)
MHVTGTALPLLLFAFAFVLPEMNLPPTFLHVFYVSAQIGSWLHVIPFFITMFTGAAFGPSSFPTPDDTTWTTIFTGPYASLCSVLLIACGVSCLISVVLCFVGILLGPPTVGDAKLLNRGTSFDRNQARGGSFSAPRRSV